MSIPHLSFSDFNVDDSANGQLGGGSYSDVRRGYIRADRLARSPGADNPATGVDGTREASGAAEGGHEEDSGGEGREGELVAVAVKLAGLGRSGAEADRAFAAEVSVAARLGKHANIIQILAYSLDPPAIAMEIAPLGSLYDVLNEDEDPLVEANMASGALKLRIATQVADALRVMHALGVVHRDIKPSNILMAGDFVPKLSDFALARAHRGDQGAAGGGRKDGAAPAGGELEAMVGTLRYMAPELQEDGVAASEATDVYSFGILLNELVTEEEPYGEMNMEFMADGGEEAAVAYAKLGNRPNLASERQASHALRGLITQCWAVEAAKRPRFADIISVLQNNPDIRCLDRVA